MSKIEPSIWMESRTNGPELGKLTGRASELFCVRWSRTMHSGGLIYGGRRLRHEYFLEESSVQTCLCSFFWLVGFMIWFKSWSRVSLQCYLHLIFSPCVTSLPLVDSFLILLTSIHVFTPIFVGQELLEIMRDSSEVTLLDGLCGGCACDLNRCYSATAWHTFSYSVLHFTLHGATGTLGLDCDAASWYLAQ